MINAAITQMEDALDLPLPRYMTAGSAGMDLYANLHETLVIKPGEIRLVPLGIAIALPEGYEAQIRPRSGLALKHGISMPNTPGTVDSDYRGELMVPLINLGKEKFSINRGDRVAQMVVARYERVSWEQMERLPETERGEGGFGHTGVAGQ